MSFTYKHGPWTTLAYDIRTWMRNLGLPELYQAVHLSGKVRNVLVQVQVPGLGLLSFDAWAATMTTTVGTLAKNDLLQIQMDSGMVLAFSLGFGRVLGTSEHVAFVTPTMAQNGRWFKVSGSIAIVPARAILGAVPYFADEGGYRALMIVILNRKRV